VERGELAEPAGRARGQGRAMSDASNGGGGSEGKIVFFFVVWGTADRDAGGRGRRPRRAEAMGVRRAGPAAEQREACKTPAASRTPAAHATHRRH